MSPRLPSRTRLSAWGLALSSLLALPAAQAQSIYTCVDAKGRRHTADRPIVECLDREQKEMSPQGTVKRVVPPSLTAEERAAAKAREQAEADQRARAIETQRRERALVLRYPSQAAHDKERADALAQVEGVAATIRLRQADLDKERQRLAGEMEFYQKDPAKAPARLKARIQDNANQIANQQMALDNQAREKDRVNARFDEELARLKVLWSAQAPTASR